MTQLDLFVDNSKCPHYGARSWSFDPKTRLWVDGNPECRLPRHEIRQVMTVSKTAETEQWRNPMGAHRPVMMCIDPGDVHAGVAFFYTDDRLEHGLACHYACEMTPDGCTDLLAFMLEHNLLHTVVFERFRLYEDKAAEQKGSEFETSQMIGVIKWICKEHNKQSQDFAARNDGKPFQPVRVIGQYADIKKPTR